MASLFTKLSNPVVSLSCCSTKCYYHDKEDEYCIIATLSTEPNILPGIYQFNLNKNHLKLISKYPSNFLLNYAGITIDQQNQTIYLCGHDISQFIAFNLKQKSWKIFASDFTFDNSFCVWPKLCFVKSLNEVIIHRKHATSYKFNTKTHKLMMIGEIKIGYPFFNFNTFYINNKLLLIQMNKLYFFDYQTFQQNTKSLTIPDSQNASPYQQIVAGNILFSFATDFKSTLNNNLYIWCLDLIENKWFESVHMKHKIVEDIAYCGTIDASNRMLHFINFEAYVPNHYRVSLYDLIPTEMKEFYASYYKPLVMQFFRQNELKIKCVVLPDVLKEITLHYFPFFI